MKQFTVFLLSLLIFCGIAYAQDEASEPIYTSVGSVVNDDEYYPSSFPAVNGIKVEVYDGYVILRGWSGVEGRDMKVSFDEDENVTEVMAIRNGKDQDPITSAGYVYTGLDDLTAIYVYVLAGYSYAGSDDELAEGYVLLYSYFNGNHDYYYCAWGDEDEDADSPLYTALGVVAPTEGWGETPMPTVRDVTVLGYDDYIIIQGFAGAEGYGIQVGLGENDAVTYINPIYDGIEAEGVTSGKINVLTGLEEYPEITLDLSSCYGSSDVDAGSGYFIIRAYFGDERGYYFITWPQDEEGGDEEEWVNPFEGEATFLYRATGSTGDAEDWGATVFPEIENISVDVYDKYIYIHGIGGVEGYDAKIAYNEDEEVPSIIGVVKGVESKPCKDYLYLSTGLAAFPTVQAYVDYSYAGTYDDNSGYVLLAAYIYDEAGAYYWNYYYLAWEDGGTDGMKITTLEKGTSPTFNVLGQPVAPDFKGIIIKDGKKVLNR